MHAELIPGVSTGHLLLFLAVGVGFRVLRRFPWLYVAALLPGTFLHEAAHWLSGFLLGAKPVKLTVMPRRTVAGRLVYGQVEFTRLRWWNKVPVGLSPLLLMPLAVWLFSVACLAAPGAWFSVVLMILVWQCLLSCMPSFRDMTHVVMGVVVIAVATVLVIVVLELIGVPNV